MSEIKNPLTPEETAAVAIDEGIEAIRRIHTIERQMLSRAIQALVGATGKSAEEVVTVLADGLDEGYNQAMKSAYASARIVKPSLYLPN